MISYIMNHYGSFSINDYKETKRKWQPIKKTILIYLLLFKTRLK